MRRFIKAFGLDYCAAAIALVAGLSTIAPAAAQQLTLAFIPQENPEKLTGDIKAISAYLSRELGVPVRGFVTNDHAAAIEALRNGDADISFMGALPYVIARHQTGAEVLLAEVYKGKPGYTGRVFIRRDSGFKSLADLKGKSIAFADPVSESGYLYPLETFVTAGLLKRGDDPKTFFKDVYFAGGYQQAIQAVASGLVDAAGSSQYADLLLTPGQQTEVTWIAESEFIPSHTVIARKGLDQKLKEKFIAAMLKLNEPDKRALLRHVYNPDGYIKGEHAPYEKVEAIAKDYGLIR